MEFDIMTEPSRYLATQKWKEYKAEEKMAGTMKVRSIYKDLGKIYGQMKSGKKVIDIHKVISQGGIKEPGRPNFAIACANWREVNCQYHTNGYVKYRKDRWSEYKAQDIALENCLPTFRMTEGVQVLLKAPVPIIPPKYCPKNLTNDYYILWQVDEWALTPSTDPYLLKRITKHHFVVLEGWDLSPLEISVMKHYV